MLELVGDFFGRKKKCVGAGISGGGPPWAHEAGGVPWTLVARCLRPCCVLSARYSQIFQKNQICRAFGELLFSGYFFIAWIIQKTDRKYYFYFISTK